MGLQPQSSPSNPVALADVKAHLRIDSTDDDATLTAYLAAALEYVESETRQSLLSRDWLLTFDDFPQQPVGSTDWQSYRYIVLPRCPLAHVSRVLYNDQNSVQQTLDPTTYTVDTVTMPGRLVLKLTQAWPVTDRSGANVQISFTAGYSSAGLVPNTLIQAIKLLVGSYYENREAATDRTITVIPLAVESLVQQQMYPMAVG